MPHIDTHTQNVAHTQTHTRMCARTNTHTHTHTHTQTHTHTTTLFPICSMFPYLRHPRNVQGTIHVPPWYLFYPLRDPFLYLSDTHKKIALKGVRQVQTSFLLMSSYSCKRMSRDQIQKQPRVRAFWSVQGGATNCIHTHAHARTHRRTHVHTHTHTHTTTLFPISVSLSLPDEKFSRYHPPTALVPFLSSQKPFPVPLGYPQTRGLKRCSISTKNSQILSD